MIILKFGGTSVGNVERIKTVAGIIKKTYRKHKNVGVIVSAFEGVTDNLIKMSRQAASGDNNYKKNLKQNEEGTIDVIKNLIPINEQVSVLANAKVKLNELEDVLHGVKLVKELSPRSLDLIMSFGERITAYIISNYLNVLGIKSEYIDARDFIRTDNSFGNAKVDFNVTNKKIREAFKKPPRLKIITGFIASTKNDETTTLGRGGSDYTASIFAAALNADGVEIWTDVDGILTADPKKVENSFSIELYFL